MPSRFSKYRLVIISTLTWTTWENFLVSDPLVEFVLFFYFLFFCSVAGGRKGASKVQARFKQGASKWSTDDQKTRQTISARLWLSNGAFALAQSRSDIPP